MLAAVGALSLGLPAIDRAVPAERLLPIAQPLAVGDGVTIRPPPGTVIDARGTVPSIDRVHLVTHGVDYRVQIVDHAGSLSALAADLRRQVAATSGQQALGLEVDVRTTAGVPGRAAQFTGVDGRGGWYAAYLYGHTGAYVVVTGTEADLVAYGDEIRDSLATLRFAG